MIEAAIPTMPWALILMPQMLMSNFGGSDMTQLSLKKVLELFFRGMMYVDPLRRLRQPHPDSTHRHLRTYPQGNLDTPYTALALQRQMLADWLYSDAE
jgi:hypothetical protein